jgi:hypothetical protein
MTRVISKAELDALDFDAMGDVVVWEEAGVVYLEEDLAGSPASWPVEPSS